jgi:hypothetical protein
MNSFAVLGLAYFLFTLISSGFLIAAFKTKLDFALVFGTIYDIDSSVERKFVGNGTAPIDVDSPSCECSTQSDWCDVYNYNVASQKCVKNNQCGSSGTGCGFLWLSSCIGYCQ